MASQASGFRKPRTWAGMAIRCLNLEEATLVPYSHNGRRPFRTSTRPRRRENSHEHRHGVGCISSAGMHPNDRADAKPSLLLLAFCSRFFIGLRCSFLLFLFPEDHLGNADLGKTQRTLPFVPALLCLQLSDSLVPRQDVAGSNEPALPLQTLVNRHGHLSTASGPRLTAPAALRAGNFSSCSYRWTRGQLPANPAASLLRRNRQAPEAFPIP